MIKFHCSILGLINSFIIAHRFPPIGAFHGLLVIFVQVISVVWIICHGFRNVLMLVRKPHGFRVTIVCFPVFRHRDESATPILLTLVSATAVPVG